MARVELVGISKAIKETEVAHLTDAEQDDTIKRVADMMEGELRTFVAGARPDRDRPLMFVVRGPFNDPIQGTIHVHTMAGWFDLDDLPRDSDAYRVHVLEAAGAQQGATHLGGDLA